MIILLNNFLLLDLVNGKFLKIIAENPAKREYFINLSLLIFFVKFILKSPQR